jgi:hypothetical protein
MTIFSGEGAPAMTTRPAYLPAAPAILFALAALIDIAFLAALGTPDAPVPVVILLAALGAGTLAALVPARRGNRPALLAVVVMRVISALLALVSFFAGAPVWVMIAEAVVIVSTVAALVILRRRTALAIPA